MARGARWPMVLGSLLVGILAGSKSLPAQSQSWRFTATANQTWFSSVVSDTTASEPKYDLQPTPSFGLLIEHRVSHFHVGLGVSHLGTHLRVIGPSVSIADQEFTFTRWQVAALLTVPLLPVGTEGAGLALSAGPALSIWKPTGEASRSRFAGAAALVLNAPLSTQWSLLASGGGTVSASPMNTDELPDGFVRTTLWAWQAGIGLRYVP